MKEHTKRPIGWMIATATLSLLLILAIITIVGGSLALKNYTQNKQVEIDSAAAQVKTKQSANDELQSKYDKLESDYRNAQTALSAKTSTTSGSSASKCTSQYYYSSSKYVTTCN